MSDPKAGDVWRYPYLWGWQAKRGETEGRKTRTVAGSMPEVCPSVAAASSSSAQDTPNGNQLNAMARFGP